MENADGFRRGDSHRDSAAYANADIDAPSNGNTYLDTGSAHVDALADPGSDGHVHSDPGSHRDANTDTGSDRDTHADAASDSDSDFDTTRHAKPNMDPDSNGDTDGDADSDGHAHGHTASDGDPNPDRDAVPLRNPHGHTAPHRDADQYLKSHYVGNLDFDGHIDANTDRGVPQLNQFPSRGRNRYDRNDADNQPTRRCDPKRRVGASGSSAADVS